MNATWVFFPGFLALMTINQWSGFLTRLTDSSTAPVAHASSIAGSVSRFHISVCFILWVPRLRDARLRTPPVFVWFTRLRLVYGVFGRLGCSECFPWARKLLTWIGGRW